MTKYNNHGYQNTKLIKNRQVYTYSGNLKQRYNSLSLQIQKKWSIRLNSRYETILNLVESISNGVECKVGKSIKNKAIDFPITIIRGDIEHFFDCVDKQRIYRLLFHDNIFSRDSELLIKNILLDSSITGLPQGNPVSSTLSEIYLRDFDLFIEREYLPIFYERFVDDFVIIITENQISDISKLRDKIANELSKYDLSLSQEKFSISSLNSRDKQPNKNDFDFLGYNFSVKDHYVSIDISEVKVKKYVNKIDKYFYEYRHSKRKRSDFFKLKIKIENIFYGIICFDKNSHIERIGLPYGYSQVNDYSGFEKIGKKLIDTVSVNPLSNDRRSELIDIVDAYVSTSNQHNLWHVKNYTTMSVARLLHICKEIGSNPDKSESKIELVKRIFREIYKK